MSVDPSAVGLAHHSREWPDKIALVMGERSISYAQLDARVNRLARALRRAGVGRGDAVGAALENGFEWFELLNAVGKLGAQLVPIGYRMKGPEIAFLAGDSSARIIVATAALRAEIDRALAELACSDERLWVIGNAPPWRGRAYEAMLAAESPLQPDDSLIGGYNTLIYTSGTTGRPKGIERPIDPSQAHWSMVAVANMWGIGPDDVHLITGPLYHTAPSSYGQMHLTVGATAVLMSHFDPLEALQSIADRHVTTTFMVPTHFNRILQLAEPTRRQFDLSSMRLVLHSAAPCPAHVKRGIMELFPPGSVIEFYGASEGGFTRITAEEWLRKPGSVGQPWPGHEVRIINDAGTPCAAGEIGLIYGKTPGTFRYRGAPEKTASAFRDGFFTAGDLGYLDADGYLFIADRRTDLIISGGANIYPAEVEAVLLQHPQVADAAVVGIPDADMGKLVLGVVEPRAGERIDPDALIAFTRRDLAHYKCPRRIELVEELPREPQGKVRKHELIARFSQ
jgi:long-chain acyl-CoA synthetase